MVSCPGFSCWPHPPDPGRFLTKWFEMRTRVAQQMPSSVVGPEPLVLPRMRTGRWGLDVGHGDPPEVPQGSTAGPRTMVVNEDLPGLACRVALGPVSWVCSGQHPNCLGQQACPRLWPPPSCGPAPRLRPRAHPQPRAVRSHKVGPSPPT